MITLSVINRKGGVGKTTTAVNLAVGLHKFHDKKVLLIDADSQANASIHLGIRAKDAGESLVAVFKGTAGIKGIIKTAEGIDVAPAHLDFDGIEKEHSGEDDEQFLSILTTALMDIEADYDIVIIDCPPAMGFLSKNALVASDAVIIPITGEKLAAEGLGAMIKNIVVDIKPYNPNLAILGILMTQMQKTVMCATMVDYIKRKLGGRFRVFDTHIRRNTLLAEASAVGKSIYGHKHCKGYQDYMDFTFEIKKILEAKQ